MTQAQKNYDRLERYEREYLLLVRDEIALLAAGSIDIAKSILFPWDEPHDRTKLKRTAWLERQIRALRRKLGEPMHDSIVQTVERFKLEYDALGVKQRNDIFVGRCRKMLEELNDWSPV